MKTFVRNPNTGIYPATEDCVHALEVLNVDRMLYISATMGLEPA